MKNSRNSDMLLITLLMSVFFRYIAGQQMGCVETIRSAMADYNTCVNNVYQILFSLSYEEAGVYNVQHRCASVNLNSCRDRAENRIGACLEYNRRQSLEFTFHALEAGLRYWCDNYAQNLYDFYNRRGPNCYYMEQTSFRNCEMEYPVTNPNINEYTTEYCRILDNVLNCMQQVYERCLPHENPDLTRNFYRAMWGATPCPYSLQLPLTTGKSSIKEAMWILTLGCLLSCFMTIHLLTK